MIIKLKRYLHGKKVQPKMCHDIDVLCGSIYYILLNIV